MNTDDGDAELNDERAQAILTELLDPDGVMRSTSDELVQLISSPWLGAIAPELVAELGPELIERRAQFERDTTIGARASRLFAALGWATSSSSRTKDYERALDAYDPADVGPAERVLVELYDDYRFTRPVRQIPAMARNEEQREIYVARAALLDRAYEHHRAGAYEASVPIVLAQIEGLTADVTTDDAHPMGRMFFSTRDGLRAEIVENDSLATLDWSLPIVRARFSAGQKESVVGGGSLSRHGVLHGRSLGYGTRIFSTKCFVLLAAVVEWAQAETRRREAQRRQDDEIRYSGSDDVDPSGARRDRREFSATRAALRGLSLNQLGWRQRSGRYNPDLVTLMSSNFDRAGLPPEHGVRMVVTPDQRNWWAWRRTVTGWFFGIGATNLSDHLWLFDGPEPPPGGPHEFPEVWVEEFDLHLLPNWRG